jgi:hypothetical protein
MDMGTTGGAIDATEVLLRVVLLFATAIVAGTGLARSTVDSTTRRTVVVVWIAAAIATAADVFSIVAAGAGVPVAVAQAVLTLAIPVLLNLPAAAGIAGLALAVLLVAETAAGGSGLGFLITLVYTAAVVIWFGVAVLSLTTATGWKLDRARPRVLAGVIAAVLVVAGVGQVLLSGLAFDSRLYQTGYGLALLAAAVLSIGVAVVAIRGPRDAVTDRPPRVYRFGVIGVAAGFLVWSATAAIPAPLPLPVAGAPVLDQVSLAGKQVPVLITPQRPGPNLVHFPAGAGTGISVDTGSGPPVTAIARPGAEGTWAEVTLPAGRSELVLATHGDHASVPLDAGTTPGLRSAAGPDGPECADAALGTLVAQQHVPLLSCPADTLDATDAQALRALVGYLGSRQVKGITIAADDSPRSVQAAGVVREAASAAGLPVGTAPAAGNALVVVTGWTGAANELDSVLRLQATTPTYGYGLYLAPWLLNPPIVNSVATSSLPLSFDPRVATSLTYSVAVENAFGGENATPDGYARWLAATGQQTATGVQVYAAAQVDAMPMDDMADMSQPYPGQWIPNGTIVPVTGVLGQ